MAETVKPWYEYRKATAKHSQIWFSIFAAITIIALIVPVRPEMPSRFGFDPSWTLSMNEAVARHMKIGHDMIFTVGPYSALYTQLYHPALDHLMLLSSLIFALCYLGATLYLSAGVQRSAALVFLVFLGWVLQSRDALFFSYPLLLALCAVKFCSDADSKRHSIRLATVSGAILCIPLGLLPLAKVNMIVLCSIMIFLLAAFLLYHRYFALASATVVIPLLSLLLFWVIVGQPLQGILDYASGSAQILAGYTEAMGLQGEHRGILGYVPVAEIISYLISASVILWALIKRQDLSRISKIFLTICFTLFLYVGFKSGFVRHDAHALIAASCLLFASILLSFWGWNRRIKTALALSSLIFVYMSLRYDPHVKEVLSTWIPNATTRVKNAQSNENLAQADMERKPLASIASDALFGVYGRMWDGIGVRLFHKEGFASEYQDALRTIASAYPIPDLHGSTDIYQARQAYVLSSPNKWDPRPVFQSFNAETPKLVQLNEQHLRTSNAPDYVLFEIYPIDQHLPSLDDGISWAALLDNYRVVSEDQEFALLRKAKSVYERSQFNLINIGTYKIGQNVVLPARDVPLFAEIDMEPTFWGKLVNIFFKPTQVRIFLKLSDGSHRDYRVLPNMMKTGFLVSPLVEDTKQFSEVMRGESSPLAGVFVKEMTIVPNHPSWRIWQDHYTLKVEEYRGGAWSESALSR